MDFLDRLARRQVDATRGIAPRLRPRLERFAPAAAIDRGPVVPPPLMPGDGYAEAPESELDAVVGSAPGPGPHPARPVSARRAEVRWPQPEVDQSGVRPMRAASPSSGRPAPTASAPPWPAKDGPAGAAHPGLLPPAPEIAGVPALERSAASSARSTVGPATLVPRPGLPDGPRRNDDEGGAAAGPARHPATPSPADASVLLVPATGKTPAGPDAGAAAQVDRRGAGSATVSVTIGRIEVRGAGPATPRPAAPDPRPPTVPTLTLDAYLQQRHGGHRR